MNYGKDISQECHNYFIALIQQALSNKELEWLHPINLRANAICIHLIYYGMTT